MAEIITNAKLLKKRHFTVKISSYIQIQSVKSLCERIGLRCPSSMTMSKMVGKGRFNILIVLKGQ